MNTIATINDTLLPVVLFIIYFIFASVVRYNLKDKASALIPVQELQQSEKSPGTFTYKDAFSTEFDPDPIEEISASVQLERIEENVTPVIVQKDKTQASDSQITTSEDRQSIFDIIDRLGKRELRKLCSRKALNIQQKTNGTELTTAFMKAIVKRKFDENPQGVVEVIRDRLPQLQLSLPKSNQQQQLERKVS